MNARVLLLSDIDSPHTRKWAVSLAERGYTIGVFSLRKSESGWIKDFPAIRSFDARGFSSGKFSEANASKLGYLKLVPVLREVIAEFKPELVHAHYATSYGLLGARSKFHPFIISVWGSDVFDFPRGGFLNKRLLIHNLRRADSIFSTSHAMKQEVLKYVARRVEVTPFGVDVNVFAPGKSSLSEPGTKVIGIVKSLENGYGIDVLIRSFALVKKEFSGKVKLMIGGDGSQKENYVRLAQELGVAASVVFSGRIAPAQVADYHRSFDVFAGLTVVNESFGVSLVEAMACGKPAVVSTVPGFKEVAVDGETALFVPPGDERKTADALLRLLNDETLAQKMGAAGRERVLALYDWQKNLDHIEELYAEVLKK